MTGNLVLYSVMAAHYQNAYKTMKSSLYQRIVIVSYSPQKFLPSTDSTFSSKEVKMGSCTILLVACMALLVGMTTALPYGPFKAPGVRYSHFRKTSQVTAVGVLCCFALLFV